MRGVGKLVDRAARAGEVKAKADVRALRAEVRRLERDVLAANKRAEVVDGLRAGARRPRPLKYTKNLHRRVATPVLLCSDWHVGELVRADKVNGVNSYTQHEARHRGNRLAEALLWLVEHHRNSFELRELVVWLGGDLITGYLHPDQQQSNTLPPNQEVLLVQDMVSNLLDSALSLPGIERVTLPCSYGNHGRTTHKPQIATGAENSFEWLLYQQLARSYAGTKAEFSIAAGEFTRLQVHQTRLGFTHGDAVKYGGGVGGIMIPILRQIPRWDSYGACDLWNMGHFHSYHQTPRVAINGSLIGTSSYGMRVAGYETPAQAFYLVDAKRGPCQATPIWVTGGSK
jgi:hypothetical protein